MCNSYKTDVWTLINPATGKEDEYEHHYCQAIILAAMMLRGQTE